MQVNLDLPKTGFAMYDALTCPKLLHTCPDCAHDAAPTGRLTEARRPGFKVVLAGKPLVHRLLDASAACESSRDIYRLTRQGAVNYDRLDTWLAGQPGVQPRSRFREHV